MNGAVKPALQSEVRVKDEKTRFAAGRVVTFDDGRNFRESVSREGRTGKTGNPNLQMLHVVTFLSVVFPRSYCSISASGCQ